MVHVREDELQDRLTEVRDLLKIWMRFYRILSAGFTPENLTPEREKEFSQIKTIVAQRHRHFMEAIDDDNDKFIGQNILNMVKRVISLKEFSKLSSLEINKISIEWHDANILLNEIIGTLDFRLEMVKKGIHFDNSSGRAITTEDTKKGEGHKKTVAFFKSVVLPIVIVVIVLFLMIKYQEQIQANEIYMKYFSIAFDHFYNLVDKVFPK